MKAFAALIKPDGAITIVKALVASTITFFFLLTLGLKEIHFCLSQWIKRPILTVEKLAVLCFCLQIWQRTLSWPHVAYAYASEFEVSTVGSF